MIAVLLAIPLAGAGLLAGIRGRLATALHAATVMATLAIGLAVAVTAARGTEGVALDGFLRVDALSGWMIAVIVSVAALAGAEAPRYAGDGAHRAFYPLLHLMVFTMLLAVSTDDVGVMWVAVEGTTLASVFLVNADRTRASLEAAYKYLLICSVGIAIAFCGTVLVYYAEVLRQQTAIEPAPHALRWTGLVAVAPSLSPRVLALAFVFVVVGYGTKAGLAPMHTWLPDAHSEAPAPVSALMSGVLLSVGVYAIARFKPVVDVAAGPGLATRILLALGLLSLAVAAVFLWTPSNYKRMLAYSSVEHMGLVALGLGFGGVLGVSGALLHVANHGLAKSTLFLLAGRIRAAYGSADIGSVRGLVTTLPFSGRAFVVALFALLGLPPFGLFVSEVMIFAAGFGHGYAWFSAAALALVVIGFAGLLRAGHRMLLGVNAGAAPARPAWPGAIPIVAALAALVLTGIAWPPGLDDALALAAKAVVP
ncbi:MAG TPA: proton-conducting transporter membrane subunit [Methylomirabilota bacterium]|jgi:hydrogenase-4 component F|nr:proton-conducting transporter membrane subunit [Methylomirabilota bacterium]